MQLCLGTTTGSFTTRGPSRPKLRSSSDASSYVHLKKVHELLVHEHLMNVHEQDVHYSSNVHESYGVTRTRRTTTGYTFIRAIAQDLQGSHHLNAITIHVVVVAIQLSGAYRAIPEPKRPFQRAKPTEMCTALYIRGKPLF